MAAAVAPHARRRPAAVAAARAYLALQAAAGLGWWLLLALRPGVRAAFALRGAPPVALGAFAPGDLGIVALGSALAAARPARRWAAPLAWAVAGATSYAACYTIAAALLAASAPLGAWLMAPAALGSLAAAAAYHAALPPRAAA